MVAGREDEYHVAARVHQWKVPPEHPIREPYNFINIALWENEEVYWKAYEKSVTPMKAKLKQLEVEMVPALYDVAIEY